MKPTSLSIIDCSEYDTNDDHKTVGGGKGKFKTCPKDAVEAHEWVSEGNHNILVTVIKDSISSKNLNDFNVNHCTLCIDYLI